MKYIFIFLLYLGGSFNNVGPLEGYSYMAGYDRLMSARFSTDGKSLVTASYDVTARVWDVESGKLLLDINTSSKD